MSRARITVRITDNDRSKQLLAKLRRAVKGGAYVTVGYLGGSKDRRPGEPIGNVELGLTHEFGSPGQRIPERSHIRRSFDRNYPKYLEMFQRLSRGIFDGRVDVNQALGLIGAVAAADVKRTITEGPQIPPPNAPSTLERKIANGEWKRRNRRGKNRVEGPQLPPRTLVDTGRLVASIAWQVVMRGRKLGAPNAGGP